MSVTANTTYMASFSKRPNIMGAPDQVFQFNNFLEHLIGGIKANTISAIGTINPGSLCTQYLYAPPDPFQSGRRTHCLHWKLVQQIGKFSLIKIDITSICLFPYIKDKATMDISLNHGDDLPKESLSETDWNDFEEPIVGTLIPNFFITYFGQNLPHGDISDDKIKAKFVHLVTGYELWANTANNVVKKLDDILSVIEEIKTPESIKKHFDPNQDAKSLPLATSNGPFGAMTLVQLDDYLVAACVIKDSFQLSPQAIAPTLASYTPSNVMLHLPAEADKESETKKRIVKLMLFHIRSDIDIKATSVSNITPAVPSKGMQVVLNQPCAASASQFADLMQMTLELPKHQNFTSIRLTQILIQVMSKILVSHMLQRNFATKKVTSLELEVNSVELSTFLPQRNKVLVKQELLSEVKATSENVMDFADSHKTKGKTAIARIGTMQSMVDFSSHCINMDTIITAICSNDGPQPIFHQILLNFVAIVKKSDWVRWSDNVGLMPSLHWYCYSFLEQIFNCFADFATDFGNGNIMTEAFPITKLNMSALKSALMVLKTFCSQINLPQATMAAITVMPGSVFV
jgi:hypothetical protein